MPEVVVLDSAQDFAALEEEWEDLHRNAPLATPFQSWAWLYSWWESYGEGHELRLVTIRDGGLLVGLMPLMLEPRGGLGRLLFIGTGLTDYLDALAREGWEDEVSKAGARALGQINSWQVADLQQLRPEAAAWSIFRRWSGPQVRIWQDSCPVIDVKPWDELVVSLSRNHRSTVRRALRHAQTDGVHCEVAGEASVKQAARRLVALHREAWQGRDISHEHLTPRFESHIIAAARRMTARGLGGISEFRRGEEVIVSDLWVSGHDFLGTYMLGVSQEALRRYQWSSLYIWDAVNIARSKNSSRLDLLRGEEPYKLRWSSRTIPNYRLILGRNPIFWSPYVGCQVLLSRVKRYARSEDSPQWLKRAAAMYHAKRFTALAEMVGRVLRR